MQNPLQVTLKDIPQSEAVETRIREKAGKLNRFHDRITSCRVAVESPQRSSPIARRMRMCMQRSAMLLAPWPVSSKILRAGSVAK